MTKKLLLGLLALAAAGCPDVNVDPDETGIGPTVEFDPARSLAEKARYIPFPNDLVRDPATGKVKLGEQACETAAQKATREGILNTLDGFGTYQTAMQVTFTSELDESTIAGNVLLYQVTSGSTALDPVSATPVPIVTRKTTTVRFNAADCAAPATVHALAIVPTVPLEQKSTYAVVVLEGLQDTARTSFRPSYTWGLVASKDAPVTLDASGEVATERTPLDPADPAQREQLKSLFALWKAHEKALAFFDRTPNSRPREDILVGFAFTTQTTTDPLDPAIAGSPAAMLSSATLLAPASVTGRFGPYSALCTGDLSGPDTPAECFMKLALGGCAPLTSGCTTENYNLGNQVCNGIYNCGGIGDVIGAGIGQANYQMQLPNPLSGGSAIQGAWSDPLAPEAQSSLVLQTLITVPATPAPTEGYPTIVFGHGLTSSKEAALAIAGRFAGFGFATVAIDFSGHGSRAVRTSTDLARGCKGRCALNGTPNSTECEIAADCGTGETCGVAATMTTPAMFVPPSPTTATQCYAPFLSADLARTRDGVRQTALDLQRTVLALKACGANGCGAVKVDPNRIFYAGMSLGSIIGTIASATAADIDVAGLNVGGVGWVDLLENTDTLAIRCLLVDGLIDAGVLMGAKWDGGSNGLCTTDAWKQQPGYAVFKATGKWIMDPAEPANFVSRLGAKRVLIQQVIGDAVVPNLTTQNQALLAGAGAAILADAFNPGAPAASAAITTNPNESKFLTYTTDANHIYGHSSLLKPATSANESIFGTLRLQIDMATYLFNNK